MNKIKAARKPTPGYLVPLGADGKFPASVGQVGPPGPEGPQGQQGAQGTPGPIGPSDAFTQTNVNPVSVGAGGATLASLTLASGKYVLIGRASFQGPQQIVRCRFSPSGSSIDTVDTTVPSYEIEIVNQDTVALSASSTAVDYRCSAFGGGAQAFNTVLTAIKVGEITNQ